MSDKADDSLLNGGEWVRPAGTGRCMLNSPVPLESVAPLRGFTDSGIGRELCTEGLDLHLELERLDLPAGHGSSVGHG
ncbi:MAG: hypothetical protein ACYCVN_03355 [Acidimicrobiales bacterium]